MLPSIRVIPATPKAGSVEFSIIVSGLDKIFWRVFGPMGQAKSGDWEEVPVPENGICEVRTDMCGGDNFQVLDHPKWPTVVVYDVWAV